jgi:hypothetical protein
VLPLQVARQSIGLCLVEQLIGRIASVQPTFVVKLVIIRDKLGVRPSEGMRMSDFAARYWFSPSA